MKRFSICWILLLTCLLIVPVSSETLFLDNLVSTGGTQYRYYIDSEQYNPLTGFEFHENDDFALTVGIEIVGFADNVNDFHDLILYVNIENNEGLKIDSFSSLPSINTETSVEHFWNFEYTEFQYTDINGTLLTHTNFDLYIGATFREDVSLSIDPSTDDRWVFVQNINIIKSISTASSALISDNETVVIPRITSVSTPSDGFLTPFNIILLITFVALIISGVSRISKRKFLTGSQTPQKQLSENTKSKNSIKTRKKDAPVGMKTTAKLCPNCGTLNTEDSRFCIECGIHLP